MSLNRALLGVHVMPVFSEQLCSGRAHCLPYMTQQYIRMMQLYCGVSFKMHMRYITACHEKICSRYVLCCKAYTRFVVCINVYCSISNAIFYAGAVHLIFQECLDNWTRPLSIPWRDHNIYAVDLLIYWCILTLLLEGKNTSGQFLYDLKYLKGNIYKVCVTQE